MPIASAQAVIDEYASKRDTVVAYSPSTLDADLARIDTLAAFVSETLALLHAREALAGRELVDVPALRTAVEELSATPGRVRAAIATIQAEIPS